MCGPKNSAFGGTSTPASSFNNTPVFSEEAGGFETAALIFSQPFNSFSASPTPLKRSDSAGLRFPRNTETPALPRPNPDRALPASTSLDKAYDFGESPPLRAFDQKIKRDIVKNHRDMTASNTRKTSSLEETYLNKTTGEVDLKKWTENLRNKYAEPNPRDPLDTRLSQEQIRAQNEKARNSFLKSQIDQRKREGRKPGSFSEEGVSVEDLVGKKLSPEEQIQKDNKTRNLYERHSKLAQDETLNPIEPSRKIEDDKEAEALWVEFNKRSTKVVVPTILFGTEVTTEAVRSSVILVEDTINNVIKAKNLFMLKETLDGDLIVLPKPEMSKNPVARFLGSLATISIPGAAGAKALKGFKAIQKMKQKGGYSHQIAKQMESATGSILVTDEKSSLINHAFEHHPDLKKEIDDYFSGRQSLKTVADKIYKAVEDSIPSTSVRIMISALKQMKQSNDRSNQ